MALYAGIAAGLVTAYLLFLLLFGDWEELWSSIKLSFTSDIFSALLGRWHEDQWASVKLTIWIGISVLVAVGAYAGLQ